jgi:short-subunit dehydrogenase
VARHEGVVSRLEARLADAVRRRRQSRPGVTEHDRSDDGIGRVALVTGASAGIGRAYAELLAAKGFRVVLTARREQRLKEIQVELEHRWGGKVDVLPSDLTTPEAVNTIMAGLDDLGVEVDYLVNNAGYSVMGRYLDQQWSRHEQFVRAMSLVPAELCYRLMPGMVDRKYGRVVNVTSVAALYAGSPQMALYGPVKSFMLKLSEGLAEEYKHSGVHVTATVPGVTDTEFFTSNRTTTHGSKLKAQLPMMRAETVARQAYKACERRKRVVIHGTHHRALMFIAVHSPPPVRYGFVRVATLLGLEFRLAVVEANREQGDT